METTIRIMDLDINMISKDTFISKTQEFFTNDYLNVILFATTQLLEVASENSEYRDLLSRADFILPGDEALLSMHHVDVLEVAQMVINYKCFEGILEHIKENQTMYIISRSETETTQFIEYCKRNHPLINIVGTSYSDLEQNTEMVINNINSLAPDLLICSLDTPLQEEWILKNSTKMNSKLCIAIGGVMSKILEQNKEIPRIIKLMHLERLYQFWIKEKRFNRISRARIFKRKIAHYKNKKSE